MVLPLVRVGYKPKEVEERAYEKLKILGVHQHAAKPASKLSGGEQQRVAIARALINDPNIIMGDEPTGNLDGENGQHVMDMMLAMKRDRGTTIVLFTHDAGVAALADRTISLKDGRIVPPAEVAGPAA